MKAVPSDCSVLLVFFRTGLGWSQTALAEAAGISPSLLNDYEKGRKTLERERLEYLAGFMGIPPERVDGSLADLAQTRAASRAASASPGSRGEIYSHAEVVALRAGRLIADTVRSLMELLIVEGDAIVQRQLADQQIVRLRKRTPGQRLLLVEGGREFRNWALAERAALDSVSLAPNHPQEAREWAELAVRIAEMVPGEESWRWRLQGWTLHFRGNAERACDELPAAQKSLTLGCKLWESGKAGDLGVLTEAWLPWIEANLKRAQRRFAEALQKIDEALELGQGELRGRILLSKARIYATLGDPEASTGVLLEAEPLIDVRREPRLALALRFNLLVDLCALGRAAEARPRLPAVRALAERLGEALDLTRCTWLHGKIEAGLGNTAEALAAFAQVRRDFRDLGLAYDYALASLDTSLALLNLGCAAEVAAIAREMLWIFKAQEVHREALAALRIFCEAAKKQVATAELVLQVEHYLRRVQLDPSLKFDAKGTEAP